MNRIEEVSVERRLSGREFQRYESQSSVYMQNSPKMVFQRSELARICVLVEKSGNIEWGVQLIYLQTMTASLQVIRCCIRSQSPLASYTTEGSES